MSVTSARSIIIENTGDVEYSQTFEAAANASASGQNQIVALSTGNNAVSIPTSAVAVTIIMPDANTVQVTLKGVNGDTGIPLHLTQPSSLSIGSGAAIVLSAASAVNVRLIWT
jgi:hypothetical protein